MELKHKNGQILTGSIFHKHGRDLPEIKSSLEELFTEIDVTEVRNELKN